MGVNGNVSMSINGGRTENNNWELDGGDNMDNGSNQTLNVYPNADAIGEVKVLTSNYGAQYGRNGSGTIETSIKSGTQEHSTATVYEFVRNDDFNARNFFQSTVPEYKKNDFGYTLGGPVYIPKLYNKNKDKTFFFWSEEWRKDIVPGQTFFQHLAFGPGANGQLFRCLSGGGIGVSKTAFPDCPVNPANRRLFPEQHRPDRSERRSDPDPAAPTEFGQRGEFAIIVAAPAQPTNWREELVRIDHNFNDNVRMSSGTSSTIPGAP